VGWKYQIELGWERECRGVWFGLLDLRLVQKGEENEVSQFLFVLPTYIHTHSNSPVELTQDNIECVLELSVRFSVGMLIEQCCNFLASAVAVDTACAILILADVSMLFLCHR